MPKPLSDNEVHERLVKAAEALGSAPGKTRRGETAISAARRALAMLQIGLVKAIEDEADRIEGINENGP